jgi:hypothetical protein
MHHHTSDPKLIYPYVNRVGKVVFLTPSQFEARRVHTDIREITTHELARLEKGEMEISPSAVNPDRENLWSPQTERVMKGAMTKHTAFTTDPSAYPGVKSDWPDSEDALDLAMDRLIRSYANALGFGRPPGESNESATEEYIAARAALRELNSWDLGARLSVAFASCLDFCKRAYHHDGGLEESENCEAWTKVVEDLIAEVK